MKYRHVVSVLVFFVVAVLANAASARLEIEDVKTDKAPPAIGPFSQGTSVDLQKGKLLFVSGQTATDPKTGKLREENIRIATRQTLDNIEAILKAAGSDWKYVVRTDVFLNNLNDWDGMNEEYALRFPNKIFPARQTVQAMMPYRIEISVIALIPNWKNTP